jgi:hypothetical protein
MTANTKALEVLRECPNPWCESHEQGEVPRLPDDIETIDGSNAVRVSCPNCHMAGPHRLTEAEAITAWNTRQDTDLARMREALEPFAEFALSNVDADGWALPTSVQNDRIRDWFGPSDFRAARQALAERGRG